jgi:hypothetical protein
MVQNTQYNAKYGIKLMVCPIDKITQNEKTERKETDTNDSVYKSLIIYDFLKICAEQIAR